MSYRSLKSFPDYKINHKGKVINMKTNKTIYGSLNDNGYRRITLYKNKRPRSFYLHRIVAFLFVPNPKPDQYFEVHHLDNNRDNNKSSNLKWVNHQMNMKYVYTRHKADYRHKNEQQAINLQYI